MRNHPLPAGDPASLPGDAGPSLRSRSRHSLMRSVLGGIALVGATVAWAGENGPQGETANPRLDASVSGLARRKTVIAFEGALSAVRSRPECRALFSDLGSDPVQTLRSTRYVGTVPRCKNGVVAYTAVGSPVTWLCRGFESLSQVDASMILLHEALHAAGMGERPVDPNGASSWEINLMVRAACGLRPMPRPR